MSITKIGHTLVDAKRAEDICRKLNAECAANHETGEVYAPIPASPFSYWFSIAYFKDGEFVGLI